MKCFYYTDLTDPATFNKDLPTSSLRSISPVVGCTMPSTFIEPIWLMSLCVRDSYKNQKEKRKNSWVHRNTAKTDSPSNLISCFQKWPPVILGRSRAERQQHSLTLYPQHLELFSFLTTAAIDTLSSINSSNSFKMPF